jgi:hypothetical protein
MRNRLRTTSALLLFVLAIGFTSCASKRNTNALKLNKSKISGTWAVNSVTLEGFPMGYQVTDAFEMAPFENFTNSTWQLNGNYKGTITLTSGISQEIFWSLYDDRTPPISQFKKIGDNEKAKNVNEGYQLEITDVNKERLIMKSPIRLASGNTAYIVYTFGMQ